MRQKRLLILLLIAVGVMAPLGWLLVSGATLYPEKTPRLANIFFRWDFTLEEAKQLAKWDVLLVDMEVQHYSPESLRLVKKLNPKIKILAYLASQEIRGDSGSLSGTLRKNLYDKINDRFWLRDTSGRQIAWWPGNPIINITPASPTVYGERFTDILPRFVKEEILSTGLWDGVYYDNMWEGIDFLESFNIDLNGDGQVETREERNALWRSGMVKLLDNSRRLFGSDVLILGNGGEGYYQYINGTLYEHFPYKGWTNTLNKYRFITKNGFSPAIGIINTNVNNSGNKNDYQKMRYGLASTLMGDGFYSFDNGDMTHHEIWWYDEYEASLGAAVGDPYNVKDGSKTLKDGVWRREFENGTVIVNSSPSNYIVNLSGEYEKLRGTQDSVVNDGSFVSSVNLPAYDGIILLKSVDKVTNATFVNGSFARIYDEWGKVKRSGFFAYFSQFEGGQKVSMIDVDLDGRQEMLRADDSKIEIYGSDGIRRSVFYPYGEKYNRGINFVVGDIENNGSNEIVTGTLNGGGPHVRIFNSAGKLINPGFFAYASNFRGGVSVALGDVTGSAQKEIIVGAGVGGGPHVRIFDKNGKLVYGGFFAFDKGFRGGVNVAAADLDSDGRAEIIAGQGRGGAPHVKIFDMYGNLKLGQFMAFDKNSRTGVEVSAADIDADGRTEIITTTNEVFGLGF